MVGFLFVGFTAERGAESRERGQESGARIQESEWKRFTAEGTGAEIRLSAIGCRRWEKKLGAGRAKILNFGF